MKAKNGGVASFFCWFYHCFVLKYNYAKKSRNSGGFNTYYWLASSGGGFGFF